MSCPECKIVSIGKGHDALCYECAIKRIEELKAQVAELRQAAQDVVANRGTNIPLEASIDALAVALEQEDNSKCT